MTVCHMWWVRSNYYFHCLFSNHLQGFESVWTFVLHLPVERNLDSMNFELDMIKGFRAEFELCVLINLAGFPSSNLFSQLCHPFPSYLEKQRISYFVDKVFVFTLFLFPSRSTDLSVAESAHSESG